MKAKMTWFIIGFVASWLTWSVISYIRLHPRDYTQSCPEFDESPMNDWLKSAKGRKLGAFQVFTSSVSPNASAIIQPFKPNCFPKIVIQDYDRDGKLDTIHIIDSAHHAVYIGEDGDGVIDSHGYSLGEDPNSTSYYDSNMDGQYNTRFNPGDSLSLSAFIDSQWYKLIVKGKERYVDINGILTQVKLGEDGVWIVKEE